MSYILNIDTATESASVCLSKEETVLYMLTSDDQKNHAGFIQPAIAEILQKSELQLTDLSAIAVTGGPGSYTGLRVGMATAKGLCFAINKPLIIVNTLEVMAIAAIEAVDEAISCFCPLIDARRMEVFTAIYNRELKIQLEPQALVLEEQTFANFLEKETVCFSGSGMKKLSKFLSHPNARFEEVKHDSSHLASLSLKAFSRKDFADLAYSEPLYLKPFFDTAKK